MPTADQLARHRNWFVVGVLVVVIVVVVVIAGGSRGPRPRVAFGAQVHPVSRSTLNYTNGWTASVKARMIGVYAGSQRLNPRNGLLVVARLTSGHRRLRSFVLHSSGSVTLLKPSAPKSETDAFGATLRFVTANGATGVLDLSDDSAALSH
jgi:hypothetical protein